MDNVSRFYSAAATAVCNVGHWARWKEQKQEMVFSQPNLLSSRVLLYHNFDIYFEVVGPTLSMSTVGVGGIGGCGAEVAHEGAERALLPLLLPGRRRRGLQLRGAPWDWNK